jgi:hypothetical protein
MPERAAACPCCSTWRDVVAGLAAECESRGRGMRDGAAKTVIGGPNSPLVAAWGAANETWRECAALIRTQLES